MPKAASAFLWGGRYRPSQSQASDDLHAGPWWLQYKSSLKSTLPSLAELERTTRTVSDLLPRAGDWKGAPNCVRGLVVGAVQSGKTAHMIGLSARALDSGYRIVVVLAGLKDDLREQTARRFNSQLLRVREEIRDQPETFTISISESEGVLRAQHIPYHRDCHEWPSLQLKMSAALRAQRPVVVVVKKNLASLANLRERLVHVWREQDTASLPMLVLDDECDEASVETAEAEPVPEAIAHLWAQVPGGSTPHVSYVGYTATAAANLLQNETRDLYPADFVYLLRAPGGREDPLTFLEPNSDRWYSGGEIFYRRFATSEANDNFLVAATADDAIGFEHGEAPWSLQQALRLYLIGGAYRLLESESRSFDTPDAFPLPHSMIVQASHAVSEHEVWARAVRSFLGVGAGNEGCNYEHLIRDRAANEGAWQAAFDSIKASRLRIAEIQPHDRATSTIAEDEIWQMIQELAPHVRVRVLNSTPDGGRNLDFAQSVDASGRRRAPQDCYAIIVGGSRLSRGLTIEGLSVSYYVRWPDTPTEDTILQLSRWFGYRGAHLEYCRVVTTTTIAAGLGEIDEHDRELRFRLAALMSQKRTPLEAGLVLSSIPTGYPTAKLGSAVTENIKFSPITRALQYVDVQDCQSRNEAWAKELLAKIQARDPKFAYSTSGRRRGVVSRGWRVDEIASILDGLQFTNHNPEAEDAILWQTHRDRDPSRPAGQSVPTAFDPYSIAAYLRMWGQRASENNESTPLFNVGMVFGQLASESDAFEVGLVDREVQSNGWVNGGWSAGGGAAQGDQVFDEVPHSLIIPGTSLRANGADGLLLLYVIHKNARGRKGKGCLRTHHTPMIAVAIPDGGPLLRRIIRRQTSAPI